MQLLPVENRCVPHIRSNILPFSAILEEITSSGWHSLGVLGFKEELQRDEYGKQLAQKCLGVTVYCLGSQPQAAYLWEQKTPLTGRLPITVPTAMEARIVDRKQIESVFELAINATPIKTLDQEIQFYDGLLKETNPKALQELEATQKKLQLEIRDARADLALAAIGVLDSEPRDTQRTRLRRLELNLFELRQLAERTRALLVKAKFRREELREAVQQDKPPVILPCDAAI